MGNRLHIFYPSFLYLTILLFLLGEGTVALDFLRSQISGYSHSFVITIMMLATIFLGFIKGMDKRIVSMMFSRHLILAILPVILFILACYIDVIVNLFSSNITSSYGAFLIRHMLFVFLILQAISCGKLFKDITMPYYHLMLFVLLTGAALLFLSLTIDNIIDYTIDVSFLRKVNEGNLGKDLYSMPFGMGLLITGQNLASFLGFDFYQFSSYFFEPQIFGFMMVPAFIIFLQKNYKPELRSHLIMIFIAIVLIGWAHSFTTIAALLGALLVWIFLRNIFSAIFVSSLFLIALLMIIANFYELSLSLSLLNKLTSYSGNNSLELFLSIGQSVSFIGDGTLNIRIGEKGENLSAFSLFFWVSFIMAVLINIINEILTNKNSAFGYALLFLWICYFKTLWHLPQSPISIYLCLIYFSYKCSQVYFDPPMMRSR